jgi:catechol 2,3-dioxygenase-like lactoylglutathione lyase family enzyme
MTITAITVISIPVSNQDKSRDWYRDVVGFEVVNDVPMGPDMRWVQLKPPRGEATITLVTWFEGMGPGSVQGLVLECEDIDSTFAELKGRGVEFAGEPDKQEWGTFASFRDPDGNGWVLAQTA